MAIFSQPTMPPFDPREMQRHPEEYMPMFQPSWIWDEDMPANIVDPQWLLDYNLRLLSQPPVRTL